MGNFRKHSPRVFWSEAEVNILMEHYRELAIYKTALKEAQEAINWALEQQT